MEGMGLPKGAIIENGILSPSILGIIALLILISILYYRKRINDELEDAVRHKDVGRVFKLLSGSRLSILLMDRGLISAGIDLLFFRGEFNKFLAIIGRLRIADERVYFLRESDILGLDIETEIEYDKKPREIGLIALRSSDWKELARLNIKPEEISETYGSIPQAFLSKLIRRFRVLVGHNIYSFDIEVLRSWGVHFGDVRFIDTYALALISVPEALSHSLEGLSFLFRVDYTPHRADEDAHASLTILPKLIHVAKRKGILPEIKAVPFEPLSGLREVRIPEVATDFRQLRVRGSKRGEVVVTIDASSFSDAWYPKSLDPSSDLGDLTPLQRLALTIAKSFAAAGGDPERLRALEMPYEDLKRALASVVERITRDNQLRDPSEGFVVEYRYLKDLLGRMRGRVESKIVLRGAYLLRAYYQDYSSLLKQLSATFSKVELETPFDLAVDVEYRRPEVKRTLYLVKDGIDKSSRHSNLFGGLLAAVIQRGRSLVLVSNSAEEIVSREVSYRMRARAEVHRSGDLIRTLERVNKFASMGYNIVLYSTRTLVRSGEEVMLKSLVEVLRLSGGTCIIVNADRELIRRLNLSDFVEEVEVRPLAPPISMSYATFPSLKEAIKELEEIVRDVWGFSLRPYQRRLVARLLMPYTYQGLLLDRPFSIAILPTGSGKSLIFQSVALFLRRKIGGTTVVISPLLALIEDHLNSLLSRGVRACAITSMARDRLDEYIRGLARGGYDIVYITPEQLEKEEVRRSLERADINYLVIDEIHTLYKWGRTFRPSYEYLAQYIKRSREYGLWLPLAGFTATLPGKGLEEVIKVLTGDEKFNMEEIDFNTDFDPSKPDTEQVKVFKGPAIRDNIIIDVVEAPSGQERLYKLLNVVSELSRWADSFSGSSPWLGIIYTGFVRSTKEHENAPYIADFLSENLGRNVIYFHGQMSDSEKKDVLNRIYRVSRGEAKEPRIVVATKAFGLGVDIPNVRWVVHYMMPESIEDYYQEIGRGGRDGKICRAVMLYSPGYDYERRLALIKRTLLDPMLVTKIYSAISRADEGASVPMILLAPLLLWKYDGSDLMDSLRSQGRLPEFLENAIERALNTLSNLNILNYDIVREKFVLVDRRSFKGPLYPINGKGLTGDTQAVGRGDLYLSESGDIIVDERRKQNWIPVTNVPTQAIKVNSIKRVPIEEVAAFISDDQFHTLFSLYLMNEFSSLLLKASREERDSIAKRRIEEYLSSSIEELYRDMVRGLREQVIEDHREFLKYYNPLMRNGYIHYRAAYINKEYLCELLSFVALLYMVENGVPGMKLAFLVPHGYRKMILSKLEEKMKNYGLPLMEPVVLNIKREEVGHLDGEAMREKLAGAEAIFFLATHPTLHRVTKTLRGKVFRIYVMKR